MSVKFFSDIIDAIGKVWDSIKGIANIPKKERAKNRDQFIDTLDLMDHAILLINTRLRDILGIIKEGNLDRINEELYRLGDFDEWLQIERDVRLCRNLRIAKREMESTVDRFKAWISIKDIHELATRFDNIFTGETELADYITSCLDDLANFQYENELEKIENEVLSYKDKLREERFKLIDLEKNIIEII